MKKLMMAILIVLFAAGLAGATSIELIQNGNFSGGFDEWTTEGPVLSASAGPLAMSYGMKGGYALFGLSTSNKESSLSQSFSIAGMDTITISFDFAFHYNDISLFKTDAFMAVYSQSNPGAEITLLKEESNWSLWGEWIKYTYSSEIDISASSGSIGTLKFVLMENPGFVDSYAGIDNVSVLGTPVPEPGTIILLCSGLLAIAGSNLRKKRRNS